MKYQSGGTWTQGTPKIRRNGEWIQIGASNGGGGGGGGGGEGLDGGFGWNQTFTDTSWVTNAGDDLNVETVTNLDASGSGSLDDAINNAASYPAVVVFEVGGVIDLNGGQLGVDNGPVWIAGETAPDPGISIIEGRTRCYADQVIFSHVGFYRGDGGSVSSEDDTVAPDGHDQLYDHCSFFWGTDETIGISNRVDRLSIVNSIVAESLYDSIHPEGTHSRGILFNSEGTDACLMGNLLAHHNRRVPMSRTDVVLVNNYLYNCGWDGELIHFNSPAEPNVTSHGLCIEDGPDSQTSNPVHLYSATLYHDDIETGHDVTDGSQTVVNEPPILPGGLDLGSDPVAGSEVPNWTKTNAGMRPANRPRVDADLVENRVGNGQGGSVDSQSEVGGYPNYGSTSRSLDVPSTGLLSWIQGFTEEVELGTASGT